MSSQSGDSCDSVATFEPKRRKYECHDCDKTFTKRYNLERHNLKMHDEGDEEDSDSSISDNDSISDTSSHSDSEASADEEGSDEEEESDDTEDEDEEQIDNSVFDNFIQTAVSPYNDEFEMKSEEFMSEGMTEKEAACLANQQLMPHYSKSLRQIFVHYMVDMAEKRKHPLFKAIMKTAKEYQQDGFDEDAAIKAAVSYRKHSIENLIPL